MIFFSDGKPYIVRLNEEVSAEVILKPEVYSSSEGFWPSSSDVEYVKLNESEFLDCGHVTLILLKDVFQLSFDFQYNKRLCNDYLIVAKEFIATSKYALNQGFFTAFVDNAFSAIELLAKANLFLEANNNIKGKSTHKIIKAAFNNRFKNSLSDFEIERRQIFNILSDARVKARYLTGSINFAKDEFLSIFNTVEKMYCDLCMRVNPKTT